MKTQAYKSNLKKQYFYPKPELLEKLNKKSKKLDKSKSLIVCELLEKHL